MADVDAAAKSAWQEVAPAETVAVVERVVCCSCHRERPKVECFHVYSVNNIYRCMSCHSLMARLARLRGLPGSISELSRANLMIEAEGLYGAALKAKVEEVTGQVKAKVEEVKGQVKAKVQEGKAKVEEAKGAARAKAGEVKAAVLERTRGNSKAEV